MPGNPLSDELLTDAQLVEKLDKARRRWDHETAALVTELIERRKAGTFAEGIEAAAKCAGQWLNPSHAKLMAGEMTAAEIRTAKAVAGGIIAALRSLTPNKDTTS